MRVSMLTFSQTGNTLKVGTRIAETLTKEGHDVDHTRFLRRRHWQPQGADVVGVGCPCFESRPAEIVPAFLRSSGIDLTGAKAFVYITSSSSPAKTLLRLAQAVAGTGAEVIGGIQVTGVSTAPSMFGLTAGRPNRDDLERVDRFAQALAASLAKGAQLPVEHRIDPKRGSLFYDRLGLITSYLKKKTIPPPTVEPGQCTLCGRCVYECPEDNIKIIGRTVHVGRSCSVCWRCWHVCPSAALSMKLTPGLGGLIEHTLWSEALERLFGELAPDEERGPNLYREAFARKVRLRYDRKSPTAEYYYVGDADQSRE